MRERRLVIEREKKTMVEVDVAVARSMEERKKNINSSSSTSSVPSSASRCPTRFPRRRHLGASATLGAAATQGRASPSGGRRCRPSFFLSFSSLSYGRKQSKRELSTTPVFVFRFFFVDFEKETNALFVLVFVFSLLPMRLDEKRGVSFPSDAKKRRKSVFSECKERKKKKSRCLPFLFFSSFSFSLCC